MKAKLLRDMRSSKRDAQSGRREPQPAGTIVDHPDAYRLVQMGVAEPFDDECRSKCNRTPERMQDAQAMAERTRLGVHPEDFEPYERGWMVGYKRTNKAPKKDLLGYTSNVWKPGPNWKEYEALLSAREDEEVAAEESESAE